MLRTLKVALIAGALILTPLALRANTLTETFTVPLSSGTTLPAVLIPSGLSLFNPADGTLTGITVSVSGQATWTSSYSSPLLLAYIDSVTDLTGTGSTSDTFSSPGPININVEGTSTPPSLALFTGTGDFNGDLLALEVSQLETGDTIAASIPLAGTITYDYTPAATPEPASLLLFGTGLLGLAGLVGRRPRPKAPRLIP